MRTKISAGVLLVLLLIWLGYALQKAKHSPAIIGNPVVIEIDKGDSFKQISDKLLNQQVQFTPFWFKVIAFSEGAVKKLKSGEYELAVGLTLPDILTLFVQGKTKQYAITFPEGWSLKDVLRELERNPNLEHTLTKNDVPSLTQKLANTLKPVNGRLPDMPFPEGMIFPDTYYFDKHTTDIAVLDRKSTRLNSSH